MSIWAFNKPNDESLNFVSRSLKEGISRFGWSYIDTADLRKLEDKPWGEMSKQEINCWSKANFLLNIRKGDWIVHINVPHYGSCIAGQVTEEYSFGPDNEVSDFRHQFLLDPETLIQFDRNDQNVHPLISRKLKLRGKYWRIYAEAEFFDTLDNLRHKRVKIENNSTVGIHYLRNEINPLYKEITSRIHKTHPEKKLEYLLANIFSNVPNVKEVKVNGSGFGTDYGADIIVKYEAGLNIFNLQKEETLVVQVKSFDGNHWETNAVSQIETAIQQFEADAGMIVTTASSTRHLEEAIEKLSEKIEKPVSLVAGENVAKFVLKYGGNLLFDV